MPKMLACRWLCCLFLSMKKKGNSKEESLLNHETNYHLSCCVIDQKKKELFFDGLMTVRWMMAIKFPYMLFFWPLNSYNPELILISDYHSELFVYSLASLQCNLRLVLSVLYYVTYPYICIEVTVIICCKYFLINR